jgi:carbon-monoxide dehydrogenase medium subunit
VKPAPFAYHRPRTLAEALTLWSDAGGEAVWLAGGQSLIPAMAMRLNQPEALIDLGRIAELRGISVADGVVRIGAMTAYADMLANRALCDALPLLARALTHVAHPAIRNRGTIGGSLALSDPAAEMPAVMLALDARIVVMGEGGERGIAAGDFLTGMYETALAPGEIITRIDIPVQDARPWDFREIARRHGDYALAGLALRGGADPRVVWFGLSTHAQRDGAAEAALAAGEDAVAVALEGIEVMGDSVTGAETRTHLARVLLSRAIKEMRT